MVFVLALVWARVSDLCIWWQVAVGVAAFLVIVLLLVRGVNRSRIKDRRMLERLDEICESIRADVVEAVQTNMQTQRESERRLASRLDEMQSLLERNLEALDPSYQRPVRARAKFSINVGAVETTLRLTQQELPWPRRFRLRIMTILRWIWGTHDA